MFRTGHRTDHLTAVEPVTQPEEAPEPVVEDAPREEPVATVAPRRTIAVILSGGGSDGATGAVALHDFGGTVIAADKASSAHFAMPEAAISRDDAVDYVLPTDDIPALLVSLTGSAADQVLLSGDTGHGLPSGDVDG